MQYLNLFIAHRVGGKGHRRLHGSKGEQLQDVVLQNIPDHASAIEVFRATINSDSLGNCDLHTFNIAAVPQRLEDTIGEAEYEDILDSFLAQVMVYAVDLIFIKALVNFIFQLFG